MIFLIEFGIASDYNRMFAYISAVPASNMLAELIMIGKTGCMQGGIDSKCLYYTVMIIMWIIILVNAAFNGFAAY